MSRMSTHVANGLSKKSAAAVVDTWTWTRLSLGVAHSPRHSLKYSAEEGGEQLLVREAGCAAVVAAFELWGLRVRVREASLCYGYCFFELLL